MSILYFEEISPTPLSIWAHMEPFIPNLKHKYYYFNSIFVVNCSSFSSKMVILRQRYFFVKLGLPQSFSQLWHALQGPSCILDSANWSSLCADISETFPNRLPLFCDGPCSLITECDRRGIRNNSDDSRSLRSDTITFIRVPDTGIYLKHFGKSTLVT